MTIKNVRWSLQHWSCQEPQVYLVLGGSSDYGVQKRKGAMFRWKWKSGKYHGWMGCRGTSSIHRWQWGWSCAAPQVMGFIAKPTLWMCCPYASPPPFLKDHIGGSDFSDLWLKTNTMLTVANLRQIIPVLTECSVSLMSVNVHMFHAPIVKGLKATVWDLKFGPQEWVTCWLRLGSQMYLQWPLITSHFVRASPLGVGCGNLE